MGTATATIKTTTLTKPPMIASNVINAIETKGNARHLLSLDFWMTNGMMITRTALRNAT
jgi:hypothetical protein